MKIRPSDLLSIAQGMCVRKLTTREGRKNHLKREEGTISGTYTEPGIVYVPSRKQGKVASSWSTEYSEGIISVGKISPTL